MDRRAHVTPLLLRIRGILRGLERFLDVVVERGAIAVGDPPPALGLRHRDEEPRLAVAAARREGAGLADLADQLGWHRVGLQAPDRTRGADAFEQRDFFAGADDV